MRPTKCRVNWTFHLGEEVPNTFSRWQQWQPCWIYDGNIFSYFLSRVTPIIPKKFLVNWPFCSGAGQIHFQDGGGGGQDGFTMGMI